MLSTERVEFDKQLKIMMGGFPGYFLTDERLEAYWRGLQKMQLSSLIRVVDHVLSEDGPEKIPSVSAMWTAYRSLKAPRADMREQPEHNGKLTRQQHLIHLRKMALMSARREKMPMFRDKIIWWEYVPYLHQAKNKAEWEQWAIDYENKPDDFFMERAYALMKLWGEKLPNTADFDYLAMA